MGEVQQEWRRIEQAVDATPHPIDRWCSGPDWFIPVHQGFGRQTEPLALATDDHSGFALLARYRTERGQRLIGPIEPLWGFATPLVGAAPGRLAKAVVNHLLTISGWSTFFMTGMPDDLQIPATTGRSDHCSTTPNRSMTMTVATSLASIGDVRLSEGITRQVADLSGGHDHWLAGRSRTFRRNLRQASARAEGAGLAIVDIADDPDLLDRMLVVEHRSWKGREGSGITSTEMTTMYRTMIERLRTRGRLEAFAARLNGTDVGYILGGIRGTRYRGLQISYVADHPELSIGNLLQHHQLRRLCNDGLADTYDLGMDFDYKRRWADRAERSVTLIVRRSR